METPKLRFKEFDGDWDTSKIDKIASVTSGGTPSRANPEYWNGDIPWVTTSLVDFNVIHSVEEFITKEGVNNSSAKLFPKDTILMAMYGQGITRGKVTILGIEATTNQACCAIKLKDGYDTQFIFQNLMSRYDEIRDLSNDGGQKNLSAGIIKDIEISIPSKGEQTKIASFLSAVDEKISQLTQKHKLLSQYKQGMMQKLFSQQIRFKADDGSEFGEWDQSELKEVAQINPKVKKLPEKFIYIDLESVEKGQLLLEKNITLSEAPSRAQRVLLKGDVLFQMVRPYQQNNYYFELDGQYVASTGYAQIRTELNSKFIYYALHEKSFLDEVMNRCTGTSYPAINSSDLSTIEIGIPCLEEQTKIANFLSAIDQKIEGMAQQIEQAKQWKKGLLQQMFV